MWAEISEAYLNLLVCFSRLINTILGGKHDEMLSARVYRENNKWGVFIIDALFFWEKDHCRICYEWEIEEKQKCSILL